MPIELREEDGNRETPTSALQPFRVIPAEELARLERLGRKLRYGRDEPVFSQGEPADHALLLLQGRLTVVLEVDGKLRNVGDVWPGEVTGETALFQEDAVRSATVRAVTPSVCLVVNDELLGHARHTRALAAAQNHLLATMARRIRSTNVALRKVWQEQRAAAAQSQAADAPTPASVRQRLAHLFGGLR